MHSRVVRARPASSAILSLTTAVAVASGLSSTLVTRRPAAADTVVVQRESPDLDAQPSLLELSHRANEAIGLLASEVIELEFVPEPGRSLALRLPIDGVEQTLELVPHSVRAEGYELLLQVEGGALVSTEPGPVRTVRGSLRDVPGSIVAGGTSDEGLTAIITMPDGARVAIEPLAGRVAGADQRHHVIYRVVDAIPSGGTCGNVLELAPMEGPEEAPNGGGLGSPPLGTLFCTEIACDADRDYYLAWSASPTAVENRINLVINTLNIQYESQLQITHVITTVIVRTVEPDPYSQLQSDALLCEFIEEWTNDLQSISFDVAKLFTGKEISGSVIGQAANFGEICDRIGSCGPGLDDGGYCYSENDCCGSFACATDLAAHELGHLWDAVHCTCPGFTMHPSIQCANWFTLDTVLDIENFRDSISCLEVNCETVTGVVNDECADADVIGAMANLTINNAQATPAQNDGGSGDPDLPPGSPSCQWQSPSVPTNVHNTLWFRFTAADTSVEIKTCVSTDVDESILALYGGTCGSLVELACGEDQCGPGNNLSRICYGGLVPGQPYYVMVGNPGGWNGSDPGNIEFDLVTPCPQIGPQAGACCDEGSCTFVVGPQCAATGGQFQGAGTTCGPNPCPEPTGACCFSNGGCILLTSFDCIGSAGNFAGNHTVCAPNPCAQPGGACCFSDGGCQAQTSGACASLGGAYQGDGIACFPNPCPGELGACCLDECIELTQSDCGLAGGSYLGDGILCAGDPCTPPVGACCLVGVCIVLDQAECSGNGGSYHGNGSGCKSASCPQSCPEDLDHSGDVGFGDLTALLVAWGPCASCSADLDGNGTVGFGDLTALLIAWGPC